MKEWLVTVKETIVRETEYRVDAETEKEARDSYQKGIELGNDEDVHACEVLSVEEMEGFK